MAGMQLTDAQELLNVWIAADKACAKGQSYQVGNRQLTRADAKEITEKIKFYQGFVTRLESGTSGARVRRIIIRDI
jgi:hypothetical protein